VSDRGSGPGDPYAGLLPPDPTERPTGGFGLWIVHQLCDRVVMSSVDGFAVDVTVVEN
jgi:hypothetical protein